MLNQKNQTILDLSSQILKELNLRESMSDIDIHNIASDLLKYPITNQIEKRIVQRCFCIIKGILKMKRYDRKPHDSFMLLLKHIGYFNS